MQLMIDTANETPRRLRAYAQLIESLATLGDTEYTAEDTLIQPRPAETQYSADVQQAFTRPYTVPPPPAPAPTNVVPFPYAAGVTGNIPVAPNSVPQPIVVPVAVPTPPAPVPAGTIPIPPGYTAPPAVDGNGHMWDARIHSDTKALTEKGAWRRRRGIPDNVYDNVTAELAARANAGGQAPAAATLPPAAPAPVSLPYPGPVPMPPQYQPTPLPAPLGNVPLPVPTLAAVGSIPTPSDPWAVRTGVATDGGNVADFMPFMEKFNQLAQQKGWTHDVLFRVAQQCGAGDINGFLARPSLIRIASMTLDEYAAGRITL